MVQNRKQLTLPRIELLSKRIQESPGSASLYYSRGLVYLEHGNLSEAIEDFTSAIGIDNLFSDAYRARGIAHARSGNEFAALPDLNRAVDLEPDCPAHLYARAIAFWRTGQTRLGIKDVDDLIGLDPENSLAYWLRGRLVLSSAGEGVLEEALPDFDRSIQLNREDPNPYYHRGIIRYCLRGFQEASEDFGLTTKLGLACPEREYALLWRFLSHAFTGRLTGAKCELTSFLAARSWDRYWPIPVVKFLAGDIDVDALFRASTIAPGLPPSVEKLNQLPEKQRPVNLTASFPATEVQVAQAHFYCGELLLTEQRKTEAAMHLRRARDLPRAFPENWAAKRQLQELSGNLEDGN